MCHGILYQVGIHDYHAYHPGAIRNYHTLLFTHELSNNRYPGTFPPPVLPLSGHTMFVRSFEHKLVLPLVLPLRKARETIDWFVGLVEKVVWSWLASGGG